MIICPRDIYEPIKIVRIRMSSILDIFATFYGLTNNHALFALISKPYSKTNTR